MARISRRLAAIPKLVREAAQRSVMKQAETIAKDMRRFAPEQSGDLERSIVVIEGNAAGDEKADGMSATIIAGGGQVDYARHVEFGTRDTPAQPFFHPAIRGNRAKAARNIRSAISRAAKKVGAGE